MNLSKIPSHQMRDLSFSTYTSDEIKKISVLEVTNPRSFDVLGHPTKNGVYDPRFGPLETREACETCGCPPAVCIGHYGHIILPVPIFNPFFIRIIMKLLKGSCLSCCRLRAPAAISALVLHQLKALDHGLVTLAKDMEPIVKRFISHDAKPNSASSVLYITETLSSMLNKRLEEMGESTVHLEEISPSFMVKSVVEYRGQIVNEYLNKHINTVECPTCHTGRRATSLEYGARIVLGPALTRKTALKISKKKGGGKKKSKKQVLAELDGDGDEELMQPPSEEEDEPVIEDSVREALSVKQVYLTQDKVRNHLRQVYKKDGAILKQLFGSLVKSTSDKASTEDQCPIDGLFLDVLPVPPTRFRPVTRVTGNKYDNPHSVVLSSVLLDCIVIKNMLASIKKESQKVTEEMEQLMSKIPGKTLVEKVQSAWFTLQVRINTVFDSDMDKLNKDTIAGVRQILEKKGGLFRMHMMGKRVNYAARSVISPDPYINVDEIGVPDIFAKKLTYPQPVTTWNIKALRQAVINGPDVHPGAVMVQNEDGFTVMLSNNRTQREAVAKQLLTPSLDSAIKGCKIVYRHLQNGDVLLLNRQPTLHKPSIMAHKARVLPGEKTLRLNYSNCKSYNADFDGDEMNAHFPQSELARAEAYNIASVSHQYLVPKDGTPLGGLIQDHIIGAVLLMVRGRFFNREDYQQLVFGALTNKNDRVLLLRPSILRPCARWSGKQVVSTVLINTIPSGQHLLSLTGKSKIPYKSWQNSPPRKWLAGGSKLSELQMSESEVIIRNGEILCGTLDKAHCGPTSYGLIHCCYELYGGDVSGLLLSRLARLFTHFLQMEGFTLGVHDILVKPKADKKRARLMKKAINVGDEVIKEALRLPANVDAATLRESMMMAHLGRDDRSMKDVDICMKMRTDELNNEINKVCMPEGLLKSFPDNNLQLMVVSGAKGASVNCMQISCLLGQIELEGHRPPLMLSGRTLPAFLPYDSSPRAGGFVDGRFLTGIRPQEYFFHCMAGREGLIDTAVKTSRSGYLQRCLIKHLEGVAVGYDLTVRDSDGSVIQFQYGEDALDVVKTPFLHGQQLPFLINNAKSILHNEEVERLKQRFDYKQVLKANKQIRKWWKKQKKHGKVAQSRWRASKANSAAFVNFAKERMTKVRAECPGINHETHREYAKEKLMDLWYNISPEERLKYETKDKCPDPVTSVYRPDLALGAISERLDEVIESYLDNMPSYAKAIGDSNSMSNKEIRTMMHQKVMRSICEPGEAVGLLAAQSVGEPSTQMTLNTFHFAGRGDMNVTLGIPRLREILMTASKNIATPSLEIPFLANIKRLHKKAELLKQKLTRVYLSEVLEKINIAERIVIRTRDPTRTYIIRFHLLPNESYRKDLYVTPAKILHFLEKVFFAHLILVIKKKGQILQMSTLLSNVTVRDSVGAKATDKSKDDDGDDDIDDVDGDGLKAFVEKLSPGGAAAANDDGESSDDGEGDEVDAAGQKNRSRHNQEHDLEELDEDEKELQKKDVGESEDEGFDDQIIKEERVKDNDVHDDEDYTQQSFELMGSEGEDGSSDVKLTLKLSEEDLEKRRKDQEKRIEASESLLRSVMSIHDCIADYSYDIENDEWCEVTIKLNMSQKRLDMSTLIEEEAKRAIVHHTPGIKRAFVVDETDADGKAQKMLKTDGVNIQEIVKYDDLLDLNRLYSNDVHAIAQTYGVEAAFRVIVKEIQNVFRVYGIEVDPRHLLLIADFMTFDGAFRPFSRTGMESNASPLQQMSFETTMHFLRQATVLGLPDPLKSPSSKLVVGQLVTCGTGSFGIMQPLFL